MNRMCNLAAGVAVLALSTQLAMSRETIELGLSMPLSGAAAAWGKADLGL